MLRRTFLAGLAAATNAYSQAEFRVYSEHPRLFLDAKRLRRLQRDVGRETLRWRQFEFLVREQAPFPEPAFVHALYYRATGDETHAQKALDWIEALPEQSLIDAASLRQAAIAFDWCHPLSAIEDDGPTLTALIRAARELADKPGATLPELTAAALAAIALAGHRPEYEAILATLLGTVWPRTIAPAIETGDAQWTPAGRLALWELAHAARPNLDRDLLEPLAPQMEREALAAILRNYPGSFEDAAGRYRLPAPLDPGKPDLRAAATNRVADMLHVAYDAHPNNAQFLQGWVRHDAFQMGSPYGAPYEYLWVNPYLPGLSFSTAPNFVYDDARGAIFGRASWAEDSLWLGYYEETLHIYTGGRLERVPANKQQRPITFGNAVVIPAGIDAKHVAHFEDPTDPWNSIYLVGLRTGDKYRLRVQKMKSFQLRASRGGIIVLRNDPERKGDEIDFTADVTVEVKHQS